MCIILLAGRRKIVLLSLSLSAHSCYIFFCISDSNVLTFEGEREVGDDVGPGVFLINVLVDYWRFFVQISNKDGNGCVVYCMS